MGLKAGDYVVVLDPKTLDTFEYRSSTGDFYDETVKDTFIDDMFCTIGCVYKIDKSNKKDTFSLVNSDIMCHYYPHWLKKATPLDYYLLTGETLCNNS